ncbi:hypothetical protein ACE7GA_04795 [Roseomonas sp. CCTCC AB2023176]|uniref:hypothetical protein n=1 Tax=Roseomonas sp. CCTCC AB2023176 TaxID=3342640 RepID=UPI0035E01102
MIAAFHQPPPPPLTGAEGGIAELAALIRAAVASGAEREVLWLRLSRMPPGLDRPHHRRLMRDALDLPNRARRARVFHLPGGDVAVATAPGDSLHPAVLRALDGAMDPATAEDLLRLRRLPEEAAALLAALEECLGLGPPTPPRADTPAALDSKGLESLLAALATAEVAPFLRRQFICRMAPEQDAEPVAESVRPWPEALRDRLLPGRDLSAAPALTRRLCLALEERLLASLAGPEWRASPRRLHLGISVPALTCDALLRLDAALPAATRPLLTFAVPIGDVLADPAGFALGRDLVRSRGYGLALESPSAAALALLPPEVIGVTAVRLAWSDALPGEDAPIPALPPIILAGADRAAAIAWAWEHGITLFQGRATDRWMRAGLNRAA